MWSIHEFSHSITSSLVCSYSHILVSALGASGSTELHTVTNKHILILLTAFYFFFCNLLCSHCWVCVWWLQVETQKHFLASCFFPFQIRKIPNKECGQRIICSVQCLDSLKNKLLKNLFSTAGTKRNRITENTS